MPEGRGSECDPFSRLLARKPCWLGVYTCVVALLRHFLTKILIVLFHFLSITLSIYYPRPQMAFTRSLPSLNLTIFLVTFSKIFARLFPLLDSGGAP